LDISCFIRLRPYKRNTEKTAAIIFKNELPLDLTRLEMASRAVNPLKHRIREARSPLLNPLETFDSSMVQELDIRLFRKL